MSTISDSLKSGAAVIALAMLVAVASHQLSPGPEASAGHIQVQDLDGGPALATAEPGSYLVPFVALLDPATLALAGYDAGGLPAYVAGNVCALPLDGGDDPGGAVVPGAYIVWSEPTLGLCDAGAPKLEFWVQGDPRAPFACACAPVDAGCMWTPRKYPTGFDDAGPAPYGETLAAGTWSGGCIRKPCVELGRAEVTSWPAACPLH